MEQPPDLLMGENKPVTEYLDDYVFEQKEPGFAILLTGKWGIGKTYYIDAYRNVDETLNSELSIQEDGWFKFIVGNLLCGLITVYKFIPKIFNMLVNIVSEFNSSLSYKPSYPKALTREEQIEQELINKTLTGQEKTKQVAIKQRSIKQETINKEKEEKIRQIVIEQPLTEQEQEKVELIKQRLIRIERIKNSNLKLIKVSLFGIKTIDELEKAMIKSFLFRFNILFDIGSFILNNSAAFIHGGFVFTSLKALIPLTTAAKTKKKLNSIISSEKKHQLIYIFDDLERSDIPLKELLGWINHAVEMEKMKVILIANEEKLLLDSQANQGNNVDQTKPSKELIDPDKQKRSELYQEFKEKVIGKTFEIHSNFKDVLHYFLSGNGQDVEQSKYKKIIAQYEDQIDRIYKNSGIKAPNLRGLKQAIDDFEYVLKNIHDEYLPFDNKDHNVDAGKEEIKRLFLNNLLRNFFVLKLVIIEWKLACNELSNAAIQNMNVTSICRFIPENRIQKPDETKARNYKFLEIEQENDVFFNNYLMQFLSDQKKNIFTLDIWGKILFKSDCSGLEENIKQFFNSFKNDLLDKFQYFRQLNEEEFQRLLKELKSTFYSLDSYLNLFIFFHYLDEMIFFVKKKFIDDNISAIKNHAKKYIKKYCKQWIKKDQKTKNIKYVYDLNLKTSKVYNYNSINASDFPKVDDDFQEVFDYFIKIKNYDEKELAKDEAHQILQKIIKMLKGEETGNFDDLIYYKDYDKQQYEVFINLQDVDVFIQTIKTCENNLLHAFHHAIYLRYNSSRPFNDNVIQNEIPFWQEVESQLKNYIKNYDREYALRNVKIGNLQYFLKDIQKLLQRFPEPPKTSEQKTGH